MQIIKKSSKFYQVENVPGLAEIVKKHSGVDIDPDMFQVVANMTLGSIAAQLGWDDDLLQKVIDDMNAANAAQK